jgi:hypothetical protein
LQACHVWHGFHLANRSANPRIRRLERLKVTQLTQVGFSD